MSTIALLLIAGMACGEDRETGKKDDIRLVRRLQERAVAAEQGQKFEDYTFNCEARVYRKVENSSKRQLTTIELKHEMVAVPGGHFSMGGGPREDAKPSNNVAISPFWMGKYEVTWEQYEPFMITGVPRNRLGEPQFARGEEKQDHEIVSKPTSPYTDMSFGMGREGFPAISMTQHAASKFCQWLSARTGHFYRLPTEAEWEYACRAGTSGPFSCPAEQLNEYAVYEPDLDNPQLFGFAKVGTKKPNPWGLHDMHGNVMEWCLDQYDPRIYKTRRESMRYPDEEWAVQDPWVVANRIYPRVARGGSWYDPAEDCTSTRRWFSSVEWKLQDPQLPKSIWYHTDAIWLGFRIVRPLQTPAAEEMDLYWNSAHPDRVVTEKSVRLPKP